MDENNARVPGAGAVDAAFPSTQRPWAPPDSTGTGSEPRAAGVERPGRHPRRVGGRPDRVRRRRPPRAAGRPGCTASDPDAVEGVRGLRASRRRPASGLRLPSPARSTSGSRRSSGRSAAVRRRSSRRRRPWDPAASASTGSPDPTARCVRPEPPPTARPRTTARKLAGLVATLERWRQRSFARHPSAGLLIPRVLGVLLACGPQAHPPRPPEPLGSHGRRAVLERRRLGAKPPGAPSGCRHRRRCETRGPP